ncbi:WAT1-related protein At2g37460-like [Bidens hawaiensis]|uniref:WAT1-related protein At2g37460-like n=1 Tax=Bidens hawaiensis TaxID=980011 RepID=UPI004049E2DB
MAKITEMFRQSLPFILVIFLQVGYSGMDIISKVALNDGMNSYVFAVYRHALATIVMAPFAILLDRERIPPMTLGIFVTLVFLGLLEPVISQNLYVLGMKATTATFAVSMMNGIVCSGLEYYIQGLLMRERGPVFVTAFTPLNMIIVAILGALVLGEKLFVGRVVGAMVIVAGLYLVVWGKSQEHKLISSPEVAPSNHPSPLLERMIRRLPRISNHPTKFVLLDQHDNLDINAFYR